jgi:hypothetical protein
MQLWGGISYSPSFALPPSLQPLVSPPPSAPFLMRTEDRHITLFMIAENSEINRSSTIEIYVSEKTDQQYVGNVAWKEAN